MSWTYNVAQLATSLLFQTRFLIGDTDTLDQQVQDEEINFALTQRSSIYGAAAMCCMTISSKFSRKADTVQGDLHTLYSSVARSYAVRAAEYESKSNSRGGALPYAGGISIADKAAQEANPDRVPPQFNIGMEDNLLPVGPAGNESATTNEPEAP